MTAAGPIDTVRRIVAESLARDLAEVTPESKLVEDLGADSLDFIDMIFTLEKEFGVKLREGEFDFLARLDFSNPAVLKDGALAPDVVAKLRTWLPALDREPDPSRITPGRLFGLITVETLWIVIRNKLPGS